MAKKTAIDKNIAEIREAIGAKKVIIGLEVGIKNLKLGKTEKVFLASNCKDEVKDEIEKLAKLSKIKVVSLKQPNDELGTICKKPFSISMISIVK